MDEGLNVAPREGAPYDAELRAALNVDPSPEFLARVRTRIASEPAPRRWRLAWVMVPVATASVVILGVLAAIRPDPEPVAPVQAVSSAPVTVPLPIIEPEPAVREVRLQADRTVQRVAPALPEVIVSADEQRALQTLLRIVEEGRLPTLPPENPSQKQSLDAVAHVEVTQLVVEPLRIARLEAGELQ